MKLHAPPPPLTPLRTPPVSSQPLSDKLSAVHLGLPLADLGVGLAQSLSQNSVLPAYGLGMAALHGGRGAVFAAQAFKQSGVKLEHRIGIATGEALLASGHLVGAAGLGAWCLPLLVAGTAVNTVTDYRYRSHYEESPGAPSKQASLSATQVGAKALDLGVVLGNSLSASSGALSAAGLALGAGHAVLAARCYLTHSGGPDTHSRHCRGFGHAVLAAGQIAAAAGAGAWALAPIVGGLIITTVQDLRDAQK